MNEHFINEVTEAFGIAGRRLNKQDTKITILFILVAIALYRTF